MSFVHLHVHTEFSLLDGACRIRDLPGIVKAMGQTACAVTDHGVMYGAVDFYRACKAEGVKPIIGCEVYVTPQGRTRFDKVHELDAESRHLVLLCENEEGYRNLSYLAPSRYFPWPIFCIGASSGIELDAIEQAITSSPPRLIHSSLVQRFSMFVE